MKRIYIIRSKRGLPCLWEAGGGYTNTGDAVIIGDPDGKPKKAIYIRRSGSLACGNHALIPVKVGDIIVEASHHRGDFTIYVSRIVKIRKDEADMEVLHEFSRGEWDSVPPDGILKMVQAAQEKATDYHCRDAYYIQ